MKRLLFFLLCTCALQVNVLGHVLDEYVQAAQITLMSEGVRVELHLTPGVDVADRVYALIDVDRNGQITPTEEQAYAQRVLTDLTLQLDQRSLPLVLTKTQFPLRSEMKDGEGVIRLELFAAAALAAGEHQLSFRNNHLPELGVYQANALIPTTDTIHITGQQRDPLQHEIQIHFRTVSTAVDNRVATPSWSLWPGFLLSCLCLTLLLTQWPRIQRRL